MVNNFRAARKKKENHRQMVLILVSISDRDRYVNSISPWVFFFRPPYIEFFFQTGLRLFVIHMRFKKLIIIEENPNLFQKFHHFDKL